jgi:hypothetical protein
MSVDPEGGHGLPPDTEARLLEAARGGCVACAVLLRLAAELGVPALAVGRSADRLGLKITGCQLGCFR